MSSGDVCAGAHSLNELDFSCWCRRAGLPSPTRQAVRSLTRGVAMITLQIPVLGLRLAPERFLRQRADALSLARGGSGAESGHRAESQRSFSRTQRRAAAGAETVATPSP